MSLVTVTVSFTVLMLLTAVMLGWISELKRVGASVSARESRAASEREGVAFYTSREARAEAMRDRIRMERRRRERARAAAGPRPSAPPPPADRPAAPTPPDSPEARHRATLELGSGPVTADVLRVHYRRLVVAYHPDRVGGLGAKLQALAEEETKAIDEAYAFFKARLGA